MGELLHIYQRLSGLRPNSRRAAEQHDQIAPPHTASQFAASQFAAFQLASSQHHIDSLSPRGIGRSTYANQGGQFIERLNLAIGVSGQAFATLAVTIAPNHLHPESRCGVSVPSIRRLE